MERRKLHLLFGAVLMPFLMALPLVSGCAPKEVAPSVGELSFEAAEYVNADYGFSIKYPKDWSKESDACGPTAVLCVSPAMVPILGVDIAEGATFADVLTAVLEGAGCSDIEIVSESETTLADGTPASQAIVKLKAKGFGADSFSLGVMKDNKWVIVSVITVSMLAKYDEALFSEIAHTLQFK